MQLSQNSFRTDLVFAAILLTAIVSLLLYALVGVDRAARRARGRRSAERHRSAASGRADRHAVARATARAARLRP